MLHELNQKNNTMQKIMFVLLAACIGLGAQAQKFAKIQVNEVKVKIGEQQFTGEAVTIPLELRDKTSPVTLFANADVKITATYKLIDMKSGRSDHMASGIRFKIVYDCVYKGKKQNRKVERMFFLNDKREFEEKDYFVINDKIKNTKIEIKYTGVMEE